MATTQAQPAQAAPTPYAITGVKVGIDPKGNPPPRREIRDLYENYPEQFNLYLLGLRALQDTDFADRLSYFQIAGIHGVPWVDWDHVEGRIQPFYDPSKKAGLQHPDFNGGYCVHDTILFPTWHRPYVMLLEQALSARIVEIANKFRADLKPRYVKAAEAWRLPYWDFLSPPTAEKSSLPDFISGYDPDDASFNHPNIQVLQPSGKVETIVNPLFAFEFDRFGFERKPYMRIMGPGSPVSSHIVGKDLLHTDDLEAKITRRGFNINETAARSGETLPSIYAPPSKLPEPSCNFDIARGYNRLLREGKQQDLQKLLFECTIYDAYASKGFGSYYSKMVDLLPDKFVTCPSVEKLHDFIHSMGGGNLGNIQEASFDPLFWLHHCNIDRWQACWETLHPNTSWMPTQEEINKYTESLYYKDLALPQSKSSSSYTIAPGTVVDEKTHLKPFHKSTTRGDYWTSADCRVLKREFGYTYPEFTDQADFKNEADFREELKKRLTSRYNYTPTWYDSAGWPTKANTRIPMREFPTDVNKPLKLHPALLGDAGIPKPSGTDLQTAKSTLKAAAPPPPSLGTSYRSYFVTMGVQHYALNATFYLCLFLGDIPKDINVMFAAPNRISSMTVLANDPAFITGCANCVDQFVSGLMTWDATDITQDLVTATSDKRPAEIPTLKSLDEAVVIPYLTANLNWCVVKVENSAHSFVKLDDEHLASMVITARSEQVNPPESGKVLPNVRDYKTHIEVTKGKPRGFDGTPRASKPPTSVQSTSNPGGAAVKQPPAATSTPSNSTAKQ